MIPLLIFLTPTTEKRCPLLSFGYRQFRVSENPSSMSQSHPHHPQAAKRKRQSDRKKKPELPSQSLSHPARNQIFSFLPSFESSFSQCACSRQYHGHTIPYIACEDTLFDQVDYHESFIFPQINPVAMRQLSAKIVFRDR